MSTEAYVCIGPVREWCGHVHRTIAGAERCCTRDQRGCAKRRGYSDRSIYHADRIEQRLTGTRYYIPTHWTAQMRQEALA